MTFTAYLTGTTTNGISGTLLSVNRNNILSLFVGNSSSLPALVKNNAYDFIYLDDTGKQIGNETNAKYYGLSYTLADIGGVATYQNIVLQCSLAS